MHTSLNRLHHPAWCYGMLIFLVMQTQPAWAYKVEKVCEELPATATSKAKTKCKFVVVRPAAEGEAPKEKKEEAPAGHGAKSEGEAKPKH